MTDLEIIESMLDKTDISYKYIPKKTDSEDEFSYIEIERGYVGFITCISFDKYGNLKDIGAYEY
jgi:hypothetical protein